MTNSLCYRLAVVVAQESERDFNLAEKKELVSGLLRFALTQADADDPFPNRIDDILDRLRFLDQSEVPARLKSFDLRRRI